MNLFRRHFILREQAGDDGKDLSNFQQTQDPEAQAIIDQMNGVTPDYNDVAKAGDEKDEPLPSEKQQQQQQQQQQQSKDNNPELLAGKYKTVDDLKKGIKSIGGDLPDAVIEGMNTGALEAYYQDLSKKFSTKDRKHELDDPSKNEGDPDKKKHQVEDKPEGTDKDNPEAQTPAPEGVPTELWGQLETTFNERGGITAEQYKQLEKAGIPENVVDNYIDGIVAQQNEFTRKVYDLAGGQEQYKVIEAWANDNLSSQEIDYISSLKGDAQLMALKGVKAQYDLANAGTQRIQGSINGASNGSSYSTQAEYIADVADPRYNSDARYRAKVEEKLKNSKL